MNAVIEQTNSAGQMFVEFALPMLVQSSMLIIVLLALHFLLRKKVRAVFRYWFWMLLLLKLVLPSSLSSPVSLGYLLPLPGLQPTTLITPSAQPQPAVVAESAVPTEVTPTISSLPKQVAEPSTVAHADLQVAAEPTVAITWQGVVFGVWFFVVFVLGLLLLQRAFFVKGLVAQAKEANGLMYDVLGYCRKCIGIKREIALKVSANATSPAVCGLIRPVILLPAGLGTDVGKEGLKAVLMHELAHIRRGDLWVNLVQTVLQIVYFYNPLLWLANAVIRRVREQAVDEMVLVAMGDRAKEYPQTLLDVAKTAFHRPALSLRLIGVVESKSALAGRVKHILNRPIPKTAKLGIIGLLAVLFLGVLLLPMSADPGPPGFVIKGRVVDAQTGQPIAGAKVGDNKEYNDGKFCTVTDSKGNYEYKTWYEEHGTIAEEDGYKSQRKALLTKLFGSEKEKVVNFELSPEDTSRTSDFRATLPNGVTVELVAVCDYPDGSGRSWGPDGAALGEQMYVRRERDYILEKYGFIVRVDGPEDLSFAWNKIDCGSGWWGSCAVLDDKGNELDGYEAAVIKGYDGRETTNIRIGIATSPWKTVAAHDGKGECIKNGIAFSRAYGNDRYVSIIASDNLGNEVVQRIVAVDTNGNIHAHSGSVSSTKIRQTTGRFYGLKLYQIDKFLFQTRPYEWVEFKNVSLKPGFKTAVQVEVSNAKAAEGMSNTEDVSFGEKPTVEKTRQNQNKESKGPKVLRIVVDENGDGEPEVSLSLPVAGLKLANTILPAQARQQLEEQGIDLNTIIEQMDEIEPMTLIDVRDGDEHVVISIEQADGLGGYLPRINVNENQQGKETKPPFKIQTSNSAKTGSKKVETVRQTTAPFAPGGKLRVENDNGAVKVTGAETQQCDIKATLSVKCFDRNRAEYLLEQVDVIVERGDGQLLVAVDKPELSKGESISVDLEIQVPKRADVELVGDNGSLRISEIAGHVKAKTDNGRITAKSVSGKTELSTKNGNIKLQDCELKPGELATYNGKIVCRDISGDIQCGTYNGKVIVSYADTAPSVCNVGISTYNGKVEFTGPKNFSARVDVSTRIGSIKTDLPLKVEGGWMGRTASGVLGKGEGRLEISSHTGSITIK